MNVTREVIYDLLPAYFAGEASADTRALVEEFFATDPEFGRMAARFHAAAGGTQTSADRERQSFHQARWRLKLRQAAVGWTAGAVLAFGIAVVTGLGGRSGSPNPGVIIGLVFSVMAAATWIAATFGDAERWYRALTGESD
jgi:anti-sigma factor RsiW